MSADDTRTEKEVVAAIVRTGGYSAEQVRVSLIFCPEHTGMQTIMVSCPVSVARKVTEED